jgi:hypothetical protein
MPDTRPAGDSRASLSRAISQIATLLEKGAISPPIAGEWLRKISEQITLIELDGGSQCS